MGIDHVAFIHPKSSLKLVDVPAAALRSDQATASTSIRDGEAGGDCSPIDPSSSEDANHPPPPHRRFQQPRLWAARTT